MNKKVVIKRTALIPVLDLYLQRADGSTLDLTDAESIKFTMQATDETLKINAQNVEIVDAGRGHCRYPWSGTDTNTVGSYKGEVRIEWPDGPEYFPTRGYIDVRVIANIE